MSDPSVKKNSFLCFVILISIFILPWLITLVKKKKQLGRTWRYPEISKITIQDKELKCAHCANDQFSKVEGLLTTSWVTFFHLAYWNRSASCFICSNCKNVHWFLSPKEKREKRN